MSPIGSQHAALVNRLILQFQAIGDRAILAAQRPIRLDRYSQPQPDIVLLKPRSDFYEYQHPAANDVLLLIEVSDSSLRYDREIKVPLYAQHGVAEMWLIDVQASELTRLREPQGDRYSDSASMREGTMEVVALPGIGVDLAWLFGKS